VGVQTRVLFTSVLAAGEWPVSRTGHINSKESDIGTNMTGDRMSLRARMHDMEK
jgi:hypothetical protein